MEVKFGTSGLRGLVVDLTEALVTDYTRAFLRCCQTGGAVHVGRDLRPSSPDIAQTVMVAVQGAGLTAIDAGVLPTPALALEAMRCEHAAIMITGSHIPADRNGLKFYTPSGEIGKDDEDAIKATLPAAQSEKTSAPGPREIGAGSAAYISRYVTAFGPTSLHGLRLGVYQHSSVARDILPTILTAIGAATVPLDRSDTFIPVDTEALDPATGQKLAGWAADHNLDAILSTDGDADRPMLADRNGQILPGDVLGVLTAQMLGAEHICTPVSSNRMVQDLGFQSVSLTQIGSPYVIAAMHARLSSDPAAKVAGYEANGGFLLGFTAQGPAEDLPPLVTRDSVLPLLAPLYAAQRARTDLAGLRSQLPARFTAAGRLVEIDSATSTAFIKTLIDHADLRAEFFAPLGTEVDMDLTDGMRLHYESNEVVHLRPSGNAPECRCYAEADSPARAQEIVSQFQKKLRDSKLAPHTPG